MTTTPRNPDPGSCGVFFARAWREDGGDGFRARIRYTTGTAGVSAAEIELYVADPDDVRRHLDAWVLEILKQA